MTGAECSDALVNPRFDAWTFCRRVIERGMEIEQACEAAGHGYEAQSAMVSDAARKYAAELDKQLTASPVSR